MLANIQTTLGSGPGKPSVLYLAGACTWVIFLSFFVFCLLVVWVIPYPGFPLSLPLVRLSQSHMLGFSRQQAACPGSRFNENSLFSNPRKQLSSRMRAGKAAVFSQAKSCLISDRTLAKGCRDSGSCSPAWTLRIYCACWHLYECLPSTSICYPCCHTEGGKLLQLNCKLHLWIHLSTTRNTTRLTFVSSSGI